MLGFIWKVRLQSGCCGPGRAALRLVGSIRISNHTRMPRANSLCHHLKHPGKLAIAYLFPQQDAFGVYYRKGDAIGAQLKTAVAKLQSDGTLSKLAAKYKLPAQDVK